MGGPAVVDQVDADRVRPSVSDRGVAAHHEERRREDVGVESAHLPEHCERAQAAGRQTGHRVQDVVVAHSVTLEVDLVVA